MNHFLYVVGRGSNWEDNELRYSLRSLEKFSKDPEVTIVGHLPPWLNMSRVQGIPMVEPSGTKLFRVGTKFVAALPYLPDNFIFCHDDYYLMEHIDFFDPIYLGTLRQTITEEMAAGHTSVHIPAQQDTLELLLERGGEPLDYDAHAPMPMTRDLVFYLGAVFPFWRDLQLKVLYGNYFEIGGVQGPNAKVRSWKGWRYLSTDEYPSDDMKKLLLQTFPEPSQFELH